MITADSNVLEEQSVIDHMNVNFPSSPLGIIDEIFMETFKSKIWPQIVAKKFSSLCLVNAGVRPITNLDQSWARETKRCKAIKHLGEVISRDDVDQFNQLIQNPAVYVGEGNVRYTPTPYTQKMLSGQHYQPWIEGLWSSIKKAITRNQYLHKSLIKASNLDDEYLRQLILIVDHMSLANYSQNRLSLINNTCFTKRMGSWYGFNAGVAVRGLEYIRRTKNINISIDKFVNEYVDICLCSQGLLSQAVYTADKENVTTLRYLSRLKQLKHHDIRTSIPRIFYFDKSAQAIEERTIDRKEPFVATNSLAQSNP